MLTSFRRWLAAATVALLMSGTIAVIAETDAAPAQAADAGLFDAGYIIADHVFYDATSMTPAQIQSFLEARVPTCRATTGPTCLRHYSQDTVSRAAESGRCDSYTGRPGESAATIVWKVSQSCGISPKVLIVLLEKEQGLISSSAPTEYKYRSATGYGCPDTAVCDSRYYGFFNQVYMAALQFKRYAANPGGWNYRYGQTNNVLYHPNAACGSKPVFIRNQATASLYIYTPYTPNAAALANLGGSGDSCSSYGNRNFWRMYTDWFGSTTGDGSPYGVVSSITAGFGSVQVTGWAADPDSTDAVQTHVYVDGVGAANVTANIATASLASRMGSGNTNHGFSTTVKNVTPGAHDVCVFAINVAGTGNNTLLECRRVTVLSGNPFGVIDQAAGYTGTVLARGWAVDPDTDAGVTVQLRVDSIVVAEQTASGTKSGLAEALPGYGANHAYLFTAAGIAPGKHSVCVDVVNVMAGDDTSLGCRDVTILSGPPLFHVDEASAKAPGQLTLRGWAIDPDAIDPLRVHIYVDGQLHSKITADTPKDSLHTAFYGYGTNHAFSTTLTGLPVGNHEVCMYAIGVGDGGNSVQCRTVLTPTGSPIIHVDQVEGTGIGVATIRGWSFDPDVVGPVRVHVYVDGQLAGKVTADTPKSGFNAAFPGYGDGHGYSVTATGITPGTHRACIYAINLGGGGTTAQCANFAAFSGSPALYLDEVSAPAAGQLKLRGWAIDPDDLGAARVHVYVDDELAVKFNADEVKESLGAAFGPFGSAHAFTATLESLATGSHTVCIYVMNVGAGGITAECRTVAVS